jgi:hypothetical protein
MIRFVWYHGIFHSRPGLIFTIFVIVNVFLTKRGQVFHIQLFWLQTSIFSVRGIHSIEYFKENWNWEFFCGKIEHLPCGPSMMEQPDSQSKNKISGFTLWTTNDGPQSMYVHIFDFLFLKHEKKSLKISKMSSYNSFLVKSYEKNLDFAKLLSTNLQ